MKETMQTWCLSIGTMIDAQMAWTRQDLIQLLLKLTQAID